MTYFSRHVHFKKASILVIKKLIGQSYDFWRAYSLFVARVASVRPCGAKVEMMLLGTQINYMADKSHLIIIITRTNFCLSPTFD